MFGRILSVCILSVAVAHAAPDAATKKLAKQYVDSGIAAQAASDFDTAVKLYTKAYELVPAPVLLYNIAQAHRLGGRDAEAKTFYERYLAADPKGAPAPSAREFLAEINAREAIRIAAEARAAEQAQSASTAAATAAKAKEAEAARQQAEADAARRAEQEAADRERREQLEAQASGARKLRIAGLATGGVGVASVGVAVVFGLRAMSLTDELSPPNTYSVAKDDDGQRAETLSIVAGSVGSALILGGAALYYLGHRRGRESDTRVSVTATSDQFGVVIGGSFR